MASEAGAAPTAEEKARYDAIKEDLKKALTKKRDTDKKLAQLEVQIYNAEASYLLDTAGHGGGNIILGFDGYLKNQTATRRKYEISDTDRIFSTSSVSYKKSLELAGEGEESTATGEDRSRTSTPGITTIKLPPERNQEMTAAQNKKNRDREYQRKKRANARRSAGTPLSDDESVSSRRPTKRARMADDD